MTHDIPLPTAIKRIITLLSEAVWRGRRAIVARFGAPRELRQSNVLGFPGLSMALADVRQLQRILRYVFIILAAWIKLPTHRTAGAPAGMPVNASPSQDNHHRPAGEGAGGPMGKQRRMRLFGALRRWREMPGPAPAAFANATRDSVRLLARHVEALTHALLEPLPYIRRMARALRRDTCFIGWRVPKRPPPRHRRTYWEDLVGARAQARFELHERRWLRADSS